MHDEPATEAVPVAALAYDVFVSLLKHDEPATAAVAGVALTFDVAVSLLMDN